ncbi:hypothetical protein [Vulcanococcus limneticus]|uniref:hypothetical protein n=1 Tax=Vulcanococcus limneticus TaxID=2170428 RepID=UPI00398BDFD2
MTDPALLSFDEGFWLVLLLLQILGLYGWCWTRARWRLAWFQPPVVLSVVFLYYTVFGPLQALQQGDWIDRGVNLRYGYGVAWQGAAVAFLSFLVGYGLLRQRLPQPRVATSFDPRQAWRLGRTLNLIGLSLFALISGPRLLVLLNPLTAREAEVVAAGLDLGPFANYAGLAINLLIPGILLMTAAWAKIRPNPIELALWFLAAAGIYTTLGFRYRLALLLSGMLILWYLTRGRQPRALVVIPSIIGLLSMAGLIGLTRAYGRGLDLTALEGLGFWEIVLAGFGESGIFLTSGGVMTLVPSETPYAGVTPLINTILFPIPAALLPGKDSAEYLLEATSAVYSSTVHNAGAAFLNYAEYFLMGGWPALIAGYLLLGWLCRRLWLWFIWRQQEPIAQVTYVCAVVYLYVAVSRGYLPQVAMLFAFTVLPLFIYYYRIATPRVLPVASDLAPPAQQR